MTEIKDTSASPGPDQTGAPAGPTAGIATDAAAVESAAGVGAGSDVVPARRRFETLYFALRNAKVVGGLSVLLLFVLFGAIGPLFTDFGPRQRQVGPRNGAPNAENWLGTTSLGQDVFTQMAYGVRASFYVGIGAALVAGLIGMLIGFVAGYRGGLIDELLMAFTNIVLVLPVFVVLIVLNAYLGQRSLWIQALVIGVFSWPWVARAVRAQTFSLRNRDFVDLARLSGVGTLNIIRREIAPNMASYLVMVFVLLFAGAVLLAVLLDFIGFGPRDSVSLGWMLDQARQNSAIIYGFWWWFIPPGAAITAITGAAYITNVGLDEVFNPKLREM